MGDVRVVDGEKQIYLLGFGWIKDEGGGSVGIVAEDMYENGNKIGVMAGYENHRRTMRLLKDRRNPQYYSVFRRFMVGVARLELAASWSQTMRATNCATPR